MKSWRNQPSNLGIFMKKLKAFWSTQFWDSIYVQSSFDAFKHAGFNINKENKSNTKTLLTTTFVTFANSAAFVSSSVSYEFQSPYALCKVLFWNLHFIEFQFSLPKLQQKVLTHTHCRADFFLIRVEHLCCIKHSKFWKIKMNSKKKSWLFCITQIQHFNDTTY